MWRGILFNRKKGHQVSSMLHYNLFQVAFAYSDMLDKRHAFRILFGGFF